MHTAREGREHKERKKKGKRKTCRSMAMHSDPNNTMMRLEFLK